MHRGVWYVYIEIINHITTNTSFIIRRIDEHSEWPGEMVPKEREAC